jgi:arginyl-tRNA synthetase
MVYLPEGKMKSREGVVVDADDLISEMVSLAKEEIVKRHPELSENEVQKRANAIGIGAIKFFMAKQDASKDILFGEKIGGTIQNDVLKEFIAHRVSRLPRSVRRQGGENGM